MSFSSSHYRSYCLGHIFFSIFFSLILKAIFQGNGYDYEFSIEAKVSKYSQNNKLHIFTEAGAKFVHPGYTESKTNNHRLRIKNLLEFYSLLQT